MGGGQETHMGALSSWEADHSEAAEYQQPLSPHMVNQVTKVPASACCQKGFGDPGDWAEWGWI